MIIIYGLSSKWHCWSNSCWLAVFLFLSMSSAGLVVTQRLLERKKTDARWQRKQRVRSGGRQTTMIEGAGRNVRGVASVERWREEARGRWEMPDGGTETQHEWTQAAEGWMWGRGKYEMTSKGKRERRSFHFLFPSFVLLFCIGSHTSDHTFPRDESGQKLVQAVWSVCVLLVLAVVDKMPWEGRWSGASLPFQAGRRERSAAWEKSRTFSCLWRKWHIYEITRLKSNKKKIQMKRNIYPPVENWIQLYHVEAI